MKPVITAYSGVKRSRKLLPLRVKAWGDYCGSQDEVGGYYVILWPLPEIIRVGQNRKFVDCLWLATHSLNLLTPGELSPIRQHY